MKILFVPNHTGPISHGLPLLALSRRLDPSATYCFLLPRSVHELFRREGVDVLDIDHDSLRTEMMAYGRLKPDVVIDDLSVTTAAASPLSGTPRITIRRTGLFTGEARAPEAKHSAYFEAQLLNDFAALGLPPAKELIDLLHAKAFIVPGIRSIERMPAGLPDESKYHFAGPLVLEDSATSAQETLGLDAFLAANAGRPVVLATYGNIAVAPEVVRAALCRLIQRGYALVTTIAIDSVPSDCRPRLYHAKFLPFHRVCKKAALMIHHCGSGTYQFPVLYGIPAITIATGCYDRDEVAIQLQRLGAATHIGHEDSGSSFVDQMEQIAAEYLDRSSARSARCAEALVQLKSECNRTSQAFSLDRLVREALEQPRNAKRSVRG